MYLMMTGAMPGPASWGGAGGATQAGQMMDIMTGGDPYYFGKAASGAAYKYYTDINPDPEMAAKARERNLLLHGLVETPIEESQEPVYKKSTPRNNFSNLLNMRMRSRVQGRQLQGKSEEQKVSQSNNMVDILMKYRQMARVLARNPIGGE